MNPIYYHSRGVGGEGSLLVRCHSHYKSFVFLFSVDNKEGTSISEVGKQALEEARELVYARREN